MDQSTNRIEEILSQYKVNLDKYQELYKHLHSHPELSYEEEDTSQLLIKWLKKITNDEIVVKKNIGGYGLVGILSRGDGPVVMLRADMDALPVKESTGFSYASRVDCVMHACGHDVHMTSLLAAVEVLHSAREYWSGTLLVLFQPAEEKGTGARAMVDDGLYDPHRHNVPLPDIVFSSHVTSHRSGFIGSRSGLMAGAARNYKITLQGRSAHASQPDKSIDPVLMAAYITARLQSLVSREMNPQELNALTVSSIQAGQVENIIPATAEMKIDMRTSSDASMAQLDAGLRRIVKAEAIASASPSEPIFEQTRDFPVTWNDAKECSNLFDTFAAHFGEQFFPSIDPIGMSEDFSILATSINQPSVMWIFGGTDAEYYDEMLSKGKKDQIPSNHSSHFAPVITPSLQIGIDAYVISALSCLGSITD